MISLCLKCFVSSALILLSLVAGPYLEATHEVETERLASGQEVDRVLVSRGPFEVDGLKVWLRPLAAGEALPVQVIPVNPSFGGLRLAIVEDSPKAQIIGGASLSLRQFGSTRIAYAPVYIHQDFRRRGLAKRVKQELMAYAFASFDVQYVSAFVGGENKASLALHKKLGFAVNHVVQEPAPSAAKLEDMSYPAYVMIVSQRQFENATAPPLQLLDCDDELGSAGSALPKKD